MHGLALALGLWLSGLPFWLVNTRRRMPPAGLTKACVNHTSSFSGP